MTQRESFFVTDAAANKIREFAESGSIADSMGLRVEVIGGAASGFAYDLFFDASKTEDNVFEFSDVRVFIRNDVMPFLNGTTLDWVSGGNGAGFQLLNPNEPVRC